MKTSCGRLVRDEHMQRTMILAFAIRHSMERPAMGMEGGKTPMERSATAVCPAYEKKLILNLEVLL